MIDLHFAVQGIELARHAAVPLLLAKLRITNRTPSVPVENVQLQVQVRIEAARRPYAPGGRERLSELFGAETDWDRSMRSLLWANLGATVPAFAEECTVDLPLPCSHDVNVAATKYFLALENGHAPLLLLFSGTVFFRNEDGDPQVSPIPHHNEASATLPAQLWQAMMDHYYPDTVWLRIGRQAFEDLCRTKRRLGCATFEEALQRLAATETVEAAR